MASRLDIKPLVTVIVPAFNAAATLKSTLASACAQTVRDLEILVVDDGSTDATPHLVADAARIDPRIRLLRQPNAGVSAARNAGLTASCADFVAFLDADDLWPVEHLTIHLGLLARANPPPPDLSFSVARFIDASGNIVGVANPRLKDLDAAAMLSGNPTTTTSTWVARRSLFDRVGPFDVSLRRSEDQEWLVRAALMGARIEGTSMTEVGYRTTAQGLASDLEGMRAGFQAMLACVAKRDPDLVALEGAAASASEDRYLARQALRLGLPRRLARRYIIQALRTDPTLVLRQPWATLGTLLAACVPGTWPLPRLPRRPGPLTTSPYEA